MGIRRALLVAGAFASIVLAHVALAPAGAPAAATERLMLEVGDTAALNGTQVLCRASKRLGAPTLECVRARRLANTYGVAIADRKVLVFRFDREGVGHVVFAATQGDARITTCHHRR